MADLERTIKRFELFADEAKHRGIVEVPDDLILDALELLKSQQAEIERLKEKDRLHCEDCAYNGICETPHTDKSPLCAEYSIVR